MLNCWFYLFIFIIHLSWLNHISSYNVFKLTVFVLHRKNWAKRIDFCSSNSRSWMRHCASWQTAAASRYNIKQNLQAQLSQQLCRRSAACWEWKCRIVIAFLTEAARWIMSRFNIIKILTHPGLKRFGLVDGTDTHSQVNSVCTCIELLCTSTKRVRGWNGEPVLTSKNC